MAAPIADLRLMFYLRVIVKLLGGWRASIFAVLALSLAITAGVQSVRLAHTQASIAKAASELAQAQTRASEAARSEERIRTEAVNAVAKAYEDGKRRAEAESAKVVADLRAGNLRLRSQWRGCEVPGPASGSGEPDGGAADRDESAGRIVRAAIDADEQIRALQEVIQQDRRTIQ